MKRENPASSKIYKYGSVSDRANTNIMEYSFIPSIENIAVTLQKER